MAEEIIILQGGHILGERYLELVFSHFYQHKISIDQVAQLSSSEGKQRPWYGGIACAEGYGSMIYVFDTQCSDPFVSTLLS